MKDRTDLKIHWSHTSYLYQQLTDYFEFMFADGYIEKPAYDMLKGILDNLFNQYRDLHTDLDKIAELDDDDKQYISKIENIIHNLDNIKGILDDIPDNTDIQRIKDYCSDSQNNLIEIQNRIKDEQN